MTLPALDSEAVRNGLALGPEHAAFLRGLEELGPVSGRLPLPSRKDAEPLLRRLAVEPEDAAEILAGWPSERWPPELPWLLERVYLLVRADLGGGEWLSPGPILPAALGPAGRRFHVYVFLALLDEARARHAARGIPESVSWATFADLGRNLAVDRRMHGAGSSTIVPWLTLHVRGGVYELGRLQLQRCRVAPQVAEAAGIDPDELVLAVHIPESGPLSPGACDESVERARAFFRRHFPEERHRLATCESWLLDPQLAEYLHPESNVIRFQRRFRLAPGAARDAREDLLRFVFRDLTVPLDRLPQRTTLERAVVSHLRRGRAWQARCGWFEL